MRCLCITVHLLVVSNRHKLMYRNLVKIDTQFTYFNSVKIHLWLVGSRTLKLKGNLDAHLLNRTHLVLDLSLLVVFTYRSKGRYSIPQSLSFSLNYIRVIEDSDKTNPSQPYLSLNQFSVYIKYIPFLTHF